MNNYENYLKEFDSLSYIDKGKYGRWTGDFTEDNHMVYAPLTINQFGRKMLLDIGFDTKWDIIKD